MGIFINNNIAALNAQRRLGQSTADLNRSITRLSTGQRINGASDDAAGLSIASKLNADARVYQQGVRNINDSLSVLNIADAALNELSSVVTRQLELAQQAANGVYTLDQRRSMDKEIDALTNEYNRIISTTTFNDIHLLDLSNSSVRTQFGYGNEESIAFEIGRLLARPISDQVYTSIQALPMGPARSTDAVTVDLNGDGHLDLVTSKDAGVDQIAVLLGRGDGTFQNALTFAAGSTTQSVNAGDIDKDGKIDLVVVNDLDNSYGVFFGNGDGTFDAQVTYTPGLNAPSSAELQDLNNDSYLDLVIGNSGNNTLSIMLGQQGGTFGSARSYATGGASGLSDLAIGDINGDGILDIATANGSSNHYVTILLGTGDGTFSNGNTYATDNGPNSLALADIDDNGTLDLVVGAAVSNNFNTLLGNGDGTFQARRSFGSNIDSSRHTYVTDLNGDGKLDVALTDFGRPIFQVYFGNGDGTYGAGLEITSTTSPNALGIGDFNEDGVPDIASFNHNGGSGDSYLSGVIDTTFAPVLNINTRAGALDALSFLRDSLTRITLERGNIGAMQSRLSVAANVIARRRQNYLEASSAITDADVAVESANIVRSRILQQAGAAVLAQANQTPALALVLLD